MVELLHDAVVWVLSNTMVRLIKDEQVDLSKLQQTPVTSLQRIFDRHAFAPAIHDASNVSEPADAAVELIAAGV